MIDVVFLLSGGLANKDQTKSIGGFPSITTLSDSVDTLFNKVSKNEASSGGQVYRCVYILNNSDTEMQNVSVWIEQQTTNLSSLMAGILQVIEVQQIDISRFSVGGTFSLRYTENINGVRVSQSTNQIQFVPDPIALANNVQTALNQLDLLGDVTAEGYVDTAFHILVTFGGAHAYRYHNVLEIANNSLIGPITTIEVSIVVEGSPINETATNIGFENQPPAGVSFSMHASADQAIPIGNLGSSDIFALWLMRDTPANITPEDSSVTRATINVVTQVES